MCRGKYITLDTWKVMMLHINWAHIYPPSRCNTHTNIFIEACACIARLQLANVNLFAIGTKGGVAVSCESN